jgi:hypothetical protein
MIRLGYRVLPSSTARITLKIMRTISLKLPDQLLAQLTKTAKERRVTKSWLVRESLESLTRAAGGGCSVMIRLGARPS